MTDMQTEIMTIGECMVELAPREDGAFNRNFAGDTFNTAWYLRHALPAETPVHYCSALGTDRISERMLGFMRQAGIGTDRIRRIADRTVGLYMIELDKGERSFIYWRDRSAAKLLAEDREWLAVAVAGKSLLLFSGITLAILSDDHRAILLEVLAKARADGASIAFDPNMRLRLWPDAETMRRAVTQAAEVADVVLPSFDEDSPNFGDASPEDTIARYFKAGASTVVVKNGAGRVFARHAQEGAVTFDPQPVTDVVDTTAAGDSFNAGFLAARLSGAPMVEAIAKGAALSARVIRQRGALVDLAG
ncbi:sugar kinase [Agrobacterium sp. a22-2]|uniref:sugar kinase n=1 Tax=Agrobacterium sp. a22-2 TaxID=2283840 RepID=UPI001FEFA994|nr:sugar kinase [Agrobacterium sp. a22-2]